MNLAEAASLVLTLSLKDQVSSGLTSIDHKLGGLNTRTNTLSGGLSKIGKGIGTGLKSSAVIGGIGIIALWRQVDQGIDSLAELEDVNNQTKAVIESTGSAAGLTADDIRTMSEAFEDLTAIDDKVIQSGANVLLTFTNIKEDGFEPAMAAALDMSVAMDQDLQTSIIQIGKALNDPEKGLASLSRIGVNFDEATKKIIADMIETGDVAGAQRVIIAELNKEFGGSAQAAAAGYRGTQEKLRDTFEDLRMTIAEAVLPALKTLSEKLNTTLKAPEFKAKIKDLGKAIAGIFSAENIDAGMDGIRGLFTFLKELPWDSIKSGLQFAADNAKKVVDVFRSLPPGVQAGLLTFLAANKLTGGLVASGLGELAKVALSSLRTITAANVTVIGANVVGPGGGVVPTPGPGGLGKVGIVATLIPGVAIPVILDGQIQNHIANMDQNTLPLDPRLRDMAGRFDFLGAGLLPPLFKTQENTANTSAATQALFGPFIASSRYVGEIVALQQNNNQMTAAQKADFDRVNSNLSIGNHKTDAEIARLDQIEKFSGISSRKDLSVSINLRNEFNVSGREVANSLRHIDFIQGHSDRV